MRTCYLFIAMLLWLNSSYAADEDRFWSLMQNVTITYQIAYNQAIKPIPISHAIDFNGYYFFFNGGYNYEIGRDHKVYLGGGFGHFAQLQMGYGFISNAFIVRFRQDFCIEKMYYAHRRHIFGFHTNETLCALIDRFSFGYYLEYKFIKGCGFAGGITVGMRLFY